MLTRTIQQNSGMLHNVRLDDDSPAADLNLSMGAHGHVRIDTDKGQVYLAQWLMGMPGDCSVIHIDNNRLNNQRSNLRLQKRRRQAPLAATPRQRYMSCIIMGDRGKICLGYYDTMADAALAYQTAHLDISHVTY